MTFRILILLQFMFFIPLTWADASEKSPVTGVISKIKTQEVKYLCVGGGAKVTETVNMVELKTKDGKTLKVSVPESFLDSPKAKVGTTVTIDWMEDAECEGRPPWVTRIRFPKVNTTEPSNAS